MHTKEILLKIRIHREALRFTQEFMAAELDLTTKSYCNLENGKTELSISRLLVIADLLKIQPAEFLFTQDSKNSESHDCQSETKLNRGNSSEIDSNYIKHLEDEILFLRGLVSRNNLVL